MLSTYKIAIGGRVQGVGFRPFVTKLAKRMGLLGYVSNNEDGVIIMVSGEADAIYHFYTDLIENPPLLARIKTHNSVALEYVEYSDFIIIPSQTERKLNLALTPDFGICPECRLEILDPVNRRYQYAFTTCVNCGPRWAITKKFPFERDHTTITSFKMCPTCRIEYEDCDDRRFHSQTNSCPDCGIKMELTDNRGNPLNIAQAAIFEEVNKLIQAGNTIAIKNTGGYLLCCDATNTDVIKRLRRLKKRPKKPFAILYPSLEMMEDDLDLKPFQKKELCSVERPIVIVSSKDYSGEIAIDEIAPGLQQLGLMLPYSGILELLSKELEAPVIATSGNIHGSPIIKDKQQAIESISEIADFFLHHDLDISNPQDDSVVKFSDTYQQRILFRRSRGFAPNYLDYVKGTDEIILALGGHLKSTIAFAPNDYLYLSQYLGNLDHYEVYNRFKETSELFQELFDQTPGCIIVDKHPAYLSTQYGLELGEKINAPIYKIQHHKAHFASVLGEHNLFEAEEAVLGVVWDGTGFGDDGQIWGGEFFTFQDGNIGRSGHFQYFNWMAGDKMAREPRLSLYALNQDSQAAFLNTKFTPQEIEIYRSLKRSNTLKTSSVGRLFDAVASLLGICDINTYEGEGAILLENSVTDYDFEQLRRYIRVGSNKIVATDLLWERLYNDYLSGTEKETIILNFLYTLAQTVTDMAALMGFNKIALSGGVFQNTVLIDMIKELCDNRFELFLNINLSPNDENISYGQMMYYTNLIAQNKKVETSKEAKYQLKQVN